MSTQEQEADRLDGLFAGSCRPEEYLHLIEAGLLRRSYDGAAGLLGMARLVRVRVDDEGEAA